MSKADTIQTNFTSGEVSPNIRGRPDIARYFNGARRIENFIVIPQGGIFRRSGTRFINETKDSSKASILVDFEFSDVQAYVLEFGDLYIRIFRDGGIVESGGSPVEVVTPYTESDLDGLYFAQSADILYICHADYQTRKLTRTSHTTWTLSLFEQTDGPYLPVNTDVDNLLTVSGVSDTATITAGGGFVAGDVGKYVQYDQNGQKTLALITAYVSATEVTVQPLENIVGELDKEVTIESVAAGVLTASHSVFNRGNVGSEIYADPTGAGSTGWYPITAYDGQQPDQVSVGTIRSLAAPTGTVRIKDREITATITAIDDTFVSTDVDRHLRMKFGEQQVWSVITAFTNAKVVTVELKRPMPLKETDSTAYEDDGITYEWRLGAWSDTTGWPSVVTFHEQRLTFAATAEEPQTVWMGKSGDFENFSPTEEDSTVLDDNAVTYTIASSKVNVIEWMSSGATLLIGTIGGEWQARATSLAEPITPSNISVTPQTNHGSLDIKPDRVGNAVIFVQRSGRKLREMVYNFEIDSYVARDLTIVSDHILKDGDFASDLAYQKEPNSVVWVLRDDGQLAGLTYVRDQEVFAWHRHIIGGSFGDSDAVVESITQVPSIDGTEDTLYLIVKRTIDGSTVRYVEYLEVDFYPEDEDDKDDMFFVDCGLSYSGAATDTVTGLDHLEGESVAIIADGSVLPNETVVSGSITLDDPYSEIHVGLSYESLVETLPLEGGGDWGTSQGKIKRVHQVTIRLLNSLGFLHGPDEDNLTERSFRKSSDPMDSSPPLFSGDVSYNFEDSYNTQGIMVIKQEKAYPLMILAIMPEFKTTK